MKKTFYKISTIFLTSFLIAGSVFIPSAINGSSLTDGSVTLAKLANMSTASILGRNTAGSGVPEVLSASTTKTLLSLNNVDNTSDSTKNSATATLTNKTYKLNSSLGSDATWEGKTIILTAGENVSIGQVCYFKSDGKAWLADANAAGLYPVFAMATGTISANASGEFLLSGVIRNDSWSFTVGSPNPVYLSTTAGALTQTAPSATDDVNQILGYPLAAATIYFDPDQTYITRN